ncbi:patatin-like phospholipase-domain-containing protein [Morchella snyderi]|nr:patatin-like phospholipase-domain-containing protein [Morchella snyderi]
MSSSHLPPLRLLSLDGGGVRGLSSLLILQDIMTEVSSSEKKLNLRSPKDNTPIKPCDYFDLIGGTSTGGIIAILLSRLRLDVPTCIKIYTSLAEKVFKNDRCINILGMKLRVAPTRFSGAILEKAIKDVLQEYGFDPEERMWDEALLLKEEEQERTIAYGGNGSQRISTGDMPKMEVSESGKVQEIMDNQRKNRFRPNSRMSASPTAGGARRSLSLLKGRRSTGLAIPQQSEPTVSTINAPGSSIKEPPAAATGCHGLVVAVYKHAVGVPRLFLTSDPNDPTKIWQALRATSAAPTFFEEMSFGSPKITYIDGGLGYNSPCVEIDSQAKSIWEGRSVGCVVSIGTGLQTIPSVQNNIGWLPFGLHDDLSVAGAILKMATSTTRVDNEVQRMYRGTETEYYRWDVDTGMGDISLEQWMREDEMASASRRYMEDPDQRIRCRKLSNTLARLSAGPKVIECSAGRFTVGLKGDGFSARDAANPGVPCWLMENLDLKTGYPLGMNPSHTASEQEEEEEEGGKEEEKTKKPQRLPVDGPTIPVEIDLDGDGNRSEAQVITCVRAENVCLRTLITHVPQGRYSVRFVICLYTHDPKSPVDSPRVRNFHHAWPEAGKGISISTGAAAADAGRGAGPPVNLIFSAGKPYDAQTFVHRYVDPVISADIGSVILHPDAVRVRIDEDMWSSREGKGWFEIKGDVEIRVGLEGEVGIIINKVFEKERQWIGGWSFGGVKLVPVHGE